MGEVASWSPQKVRHFIAKQSKSKMMSSELPRAAYRPAHRINAPPLLIVVIACQLCGRHVSKCSPPGYFKPAQGIHFLTMGLGTVFFRAFLLQRSTLGKPSNLRIASLQH